MRKIFLVLAALFIGTPALGQSVQQQGSVTPGHTVKWVIDGVVQDGGLGFTELLNGNNTLALDTANHLRTTGAAPTLSGGGTSPSINGTDVAGTVTFGTSAPASVTITFAVAYTNAPFCVVTWQTNLASMGYTITNTAIAVTQTGTSSNKINYDCKVQSGG